MASLEKELQKCRPEAVKLIVDKAIELRNECYKPDTASGEAPQDDDGEEETGAVLSFTVVDGKK